MLVIYREETVVALTHLLCCTWVLVVSPESQNFYVAIGPQDGCKNEHFSGFLTVDLIGWFRIDVCQDLSKHGFERFKVNVLIWERQEGQ